MKKMRKKYVVPLVTKHIVELEEGMCATSVFTSDTRNVETTGHQLNEIDLGNETWNSTVDGKNGWE